MELQAVCTQNNSEISEDTSNMTIKYDVLMMNHSRNPNVDNVINGTCCGNVLENLVKVTNKDGNNTE
uniref:Uncharacterized protein n=1 Tax=Ciona savignyi TaxID=51511 RepID=H2YMD5_CIOSA